MRARYTWMIDNYNAGFTGEDLHLLSETEYYYTVKTAYGVLNRIAGDCMGWSGAFFTLCNMAGLDCMALDILALPGGAVDLTDNFTVDHRINVIRLDGEYYFVEVFWFYQKDDPTQGDYRYMNMTTAQAAAYYQWLNESSGGPMVFEDTSYLTDPYTGQLLQP